MNQRYLDWFKQAENDFEWAKDSRKCEHFAQTCFICQQVAEKSIKSLAFKRGADLVKGHSILNIAKALGINGEIEMIGRKLDLFYISTRYPYAVPSGSPFEYFSAEQADEALSLTEIFLKKMKELIEHDS